jgi:hypothetical protein
MPARTAYCDHNVATLDVTEVPQSLEEGLVPVGSSVPVER